MRLALIFSVVAGLAASGVDVAVAAPAPAEEETFVAGEVIVGFVGHSGSSARSATLATVDPEGSEKVEGVPGARLLDLPAGETVAAAVRRLEDRADVAWAEPNYVLHTQRLPNDPRLGSQWGIQNVGQNTQPIEFGEPVFGVPGIDIGASRAWDRTTGGGGPVAIVDSGIDPHHPDLVANLDRALSRNFVPEPSLAPDPPVDPGAWADVQGHGTHVAGIVGAVGDNGLGVTGVDWQAKLAAVRVCGPDGECTSADVAAGLAYAGDAGFPVANVSLGSDEETAAEIQVLRAAIASHPDTLYVVAAGNGDDLGHGFDVDRHPEYPCALDLANLLCVAAIGSDGDLTTFSNWGPRSVDLGAPGENIESTFARRVEPLFEDFATGIDGWDQTPYPWEEGEVDGEPTLSFHDLDGGISTPVPEATATLRSGLDLTDGRDCWAKVGLTLDLHGDQTFSVEAAAEGAPAAPLPPKVYDAASSTAGEEIEAPAYLNRHDGEPDVALSFVYRANGTLTPLPSIDVGVVAVRCIGESLPLGAYRPLSGTSMATPFVAGVAALGRSLDPTVTTARLRQAILDSVVPTASLHGKTVSGGRVSAAGLVAELAPESSPARSPAPAPSSAPAAEPRAARLTGLRASPARLRLAPGGARWVRARVRNLGAHPALGVRICLRAPRHFVAGGRCTGPRKIAAHSVGQAWFRVRLRPRAPVTRSYPLRFSVHAPGLRQRRDVVVLRTPRVRRHLVRSHSHGTSRGL